MGQRYWGHDTWGVWLKTMTKNKKEAKGEDEGEDLEQMGRSHIGNMTQDYDKEWKGSWEGKDEKGKLRWEDLRKTTLTTQDVIE